MTTAIENKELQHELIELVLIGKNWLSELDLLEKDIEVLQKAYTKAFLSAVEAHGHQGAGEVLMIFGKVAGMLEKVRTEAQTHLTFITKLTERSNSDYTISLIENHIKVEVQLKDLLRAFNALRQMVNRVTTVS